MTVLVIGAGVIGVAIADALARRGADVVVLDMRAPGRGASQASAGILAPYVEGHDDETLRALGARSLELYDEFVSGLRERSGRAIEYARTGTLQIALSEDEAARLAAAKASLDGAGIAAEWLDRAALQELEPIVTRTAVGALLVREHGYVGVGSLVSALVQSARLAGARVESSVEAAEIEPRADGVDVRAADRRYSADSVVIAAGAWTTRVRVAQRASLPVRPVRGQLLSLRWTADARPNRVVWGSRCYIVPWSDGAVLVGATVEDVGFDEETTLAGVHDLMSAAGELIPAAWRASLAEVRVGLRPATPDGLPIVGPFPDLPRVVVATGHHRNGILLAPLTAEIVTNYVLSGIVDPMMRGLGPERQT